MLKEFRDFINRGNVLDLAIAVVLGGAFGAITSSLVDQVIMPIVGLLVGGVDFSNLGIILRDRELYGSVAEAVAAGAPVIQYGAFLNTIINFVIVAPAMFAVVKSFNEMRRRFERQVEEAPETVELTVEEKLLAEIRDLLKERPL